MGSSPFLEKLRSACRSHHSLVCVGLDPDPKRTPPANIARFNASIVEATADLVCAYKPNLAFYEAAGLEGLTALQQTVRHIRQVAPHALIIGDAKRGDIGFTSEAYARAMFDAWKFDAVTVNPYLGHDSMEPFLAYADRGVFMLCRTSNPGSADFQGLALAPGGETLYQRVASNALEWNRHGNVGLVVGATHPMELEQVRQLCPELPFLVPGVGSQGGDLENAVRYGAGEGGRLALINSSRGIIYASEGDDFAQAARRQAAKLRDSINTILEGLGRGWS